MRYCPHYGFILALTAKNLRLLGVWAKLSMEIQNRILDEIEEDDCLEEIVYALAVAMEGIGPAPNIIYLNDEDICPYLKTEAAYMCWDVFDLVSPENMLPAFQGMFADRQIQLTAWAKAT